MPSWGGRHKAPARVDHPAQPPPPASLRLAAHPAAPLWQHAPHWPAPSRASAAPFRGASGPCPACALLPHLHRPSPLWQEHVVCLHRAVGWSRVREQRQPRCGRIHLQGARLQVDVGVRPRPRPAPPSPPPPPPAVSAAAARAGGPAPATMCMHDSPLSTVSVLFCWYLAPLPCAPLSICRPARVRRALGSLRRCSTPKELADAGPAVYLVHTPCACVLQ